MIFYISSCPVTSEPELGNYSMDSKESKAMKHITSIFLVALFYSSQVSAWTKTFDWEDYPDDSRNTLGLNAFKYTKVSRERAHNSNASLEMGIQTGQDGWNEFGATFDLPPAKVDGPNGERLVPMSLPDIKEGDELWYRIWYYFPEGFDFSTDSSQGLKISRLRTASSGGQFEASVGLLIDSGGITIGNEVESKLPSTERNSQGVQVPRGEWHAIEHYLKFSSVSGKGVRRVWQNGKLIFEDKQSATLETSTSIAAQMFLFTYWNGGAPKSQICYLDDMVFTTDRPSNTDSHGNPYLGIGNVQFVAPPNPPSSIE